MEKHLNVIGEVDEKELMELAGASEVNAASITTSSWTCVTATVGLTTYIVDRSYESCPSTACSTRC
jgi:hypothetical protein